MTTLDVEPAAAIEAPRQMAATVTPPVVPPPAPPRPEPRRPGRLRRFVRSVFSHLIFAALVTAGVIGYLYQDMILGRVATTVCGNNALGPYYAAGSKSAAASPVSTPSSKPAGTPASPPTSTPASTLANPPAPAAAAVAPVSPPSGMSQSGASSSADPPPSPAPAPAITTDKPVSPPPIAAKPADVTVDKSADPRADAPKSATVAAAAEPVVTPPSPPAAVASPVAPASPPSDALTSAWRSAREAFNAGKPEAIDAYKSLLRKYPAVPDLAGELGNIYYAAGKWREAGEHYYEAAQRYLKSANPGYAACLLDVLRNLRSPDAERLAGQITRPCPTAQPGQAGQPGPSAANPPRG